MLSSSFICVCVCVIYEITFPLFRIGIEKGNVKVEIVLFLLKTLSRWQIVLGLES